MAVQINVAANQAALVASIQAGVQAYNQRFANNNQINLNINARAFSQPLGRITGDVKDFEAALAASNARVIAFGASTAVLGGVIRSFKELAAITIDVEKNLADINRVFGLTTSQLQKFSTDLFAVSKQTASSFDDASKAALEFSRQGLKAEETLQRTKDALTLTRLAGISTANAVDALTSTVNGFAATGISTTQILNKLVAVEQDYAVGAGDLAEALSRTGQAAQEAGVSLDQLNALVTAAQQSTARGGAVIGNALKTIFTRLQRTETLDQLEAFNIAVRDVQGNILPAVTILQNFAGAYKNLADAQKAQLSEQVAGVYQVNILKAVVNDLNNAQGVYAGALQRGASATNEAEVATAKLNRTLDALLSQTATSAQQLANNIGKVTFEPLARYGTEQLKSLVESMNEILEGEGIGSTFANGLLKGIRNILAGPGAIAAFFTLFKLIQNSFTYLSQALPQIAGITTETQNRKNIEQSILQIMQQQGPLSQALAGTMGNQAAQAQLLLQLARQQTAEYQQQSALAKQLAVQLSGQGVKVAGARGLQVTRAGGYVPPATRMAEVVGAQAGGYSPGKVVASPVGGVMNTAEDVKYIPGFAQPFINPPANSKAGRKHRQNAISRTGVDPYMASGFLPNFSNPKDVINQSYTGKLNSLKITSNKEIKEIQKVADLETIRGVGKNAKIINDNIVGTGIKYDIQEYKLKTNEEYRKEAAKLALSGDIDKIIKAMPNNKKSLFNGKQWQDNLQKLKDNKIDLTNTALLSTLKLQVASLSTGKDIEFGKQYTGLLNALSGEAFERDIAKQEKDFFERSKKGNARLDFISKVQAFSGGEAKLGGITLGNLVAKAIESTGRNYDNGEQDNITFTKPIKLFVPAEHKLLNKGFIPNFAIPMQAARIPWFKKYSSLFKNSAGDKDVFRQKDFPTFGNGLDHRYAKEGNADVIGSLYEKFIRNAMNIARNSNVFKTNKEMGFDEMLTTTGNTAPFDFFENLGSGDFRGIQAKAGSKNNQSSGGGVTQTLTKNIARFAGTNPKDIDRLKEATLVYNDPKYIDPTGKNISARFTPFELSIAALVKDSFANVDPNIKPKLQQLTDSLLNQYNQIKNTANPRINAGGFIPNFAELINTQIDAILQPLSVSKATKSKKLLGQNLDDEAINYLNRTSLDILNKYLTATGYFKGALGVDFPDHAEKKFLFTKNKGFIPNFADLDADLDTDARRMLINSGTIPFVVDLERRRIAESSAADDMFHSQIVNKKFIDPKTKKPIYPKLYKDDIHSAFWKDTFVRGFVDSSTAKVHFDLTTPQKEDKNFMQKYSVLLEQVRNKYAKKFEEAINKAKQTPSINPKNPPPSQKLRNQLGPYPVNHFNNGFIPNFNFIKGRNSFQKNWLIETAKKRNLNLNDPNVFHQLATEFAKTYPNDQGMFGLSKGFIPNFANKSIADHRSIRAIYDLFIGGKKINEKNGTLDELLKIADPNNKQFKQLKTKGTPWTVQDIKGLPISEGIYANGFIPNFAYKQAVMGLEENMSGNKAIFDTKPFPHIRNSSQPTFSSAIADHGGLSNALNDSMRGQKAAGLMSRGFVPNFVKYGPSYSYMPSSVPSSATSGSSIYYPSGNPNKPQAVSPTYQPPKVATNSAFNGIDVDKAIENFIKRVQLADDKLGFFERAVGGRSKLIDSEMIKLKDSLYKGGLSGQKLDEAMNRASKEINQQESKFSKSLSSASTAISLAGPMIAGFAEEIVFGNKKRTDMTSAERGLQSGLSTGFTAISTGAGIGASFGPFGAAIGGAAGALVGLTSALNATKLTAEELAQLNQEQVQKSQASISAASSYIEAQKSLTQMISAGASSSDIEIASKKLSDNFNEIKDTKLQEIFNATGGDVTEMTKQLQEYTNQVTKESAIKTGLFGENINVQERGSALAMGLGKDRIPAFIEELKKGVLNAQEAAANFSDEVGFGQKQFAENRVRKEAFLPIAKNILKERGFQETDKDYESLLDRLLEVLNKNAEGLIISLEKSGISSEVNKAAINFKQAATKSFNQIFLDIEQQIAKSAFDVALSFEKDSGSRRIQSAILDFSANFQDSINSFLSNNLPDIRKFDFTAATAGQKAQLQLLKSQQDYDKALAEQANDRSIFLSKNAENLTKEFKSSFLPSQASAEFFQKNILPQIQQGTFTGNAASLADQFKTANLQEAKNKVSKAGFADYFDQNDIESTLKNINTAMDDLANNNEVNTEKYKKLQEAQQALIDLQNQAALFQNKNEMTKMQGVIDTAMREKEIFEAKQENAKKELEINKQLSEARIAVDKDIAVEKARVDKENLMRMEKMKDLSANIGNSLEISKARSAATVNAMQRRLEDQRETYGMSRTQISERKFGIQADILKEQRKAEDAAINAEIQQRVLEMTAEQENTAATLELNKTIMQLIETQLQGALGGSEVIKEMQNNPYAGMTDQQINSSTPINYEDMQLREKAMSSYSPLQRSQFAAFQRIQESRVASAANNAGYNTSIFESNIQSKGFNDRMTQAEQLTFLEKEETAARNAGNLVLAGTIKRYQDQIKTKQQALQITRDDIDAQVRLNTEVERTNNTFAGRFKKGWGSLTSEADDLVLNLGENLPKMFADGLVDGIKAAIRESNNLGEALMGIASKFLDSISSTLMQSAVYGILGSIGVPNLPVGGKQRGGIIRAQSGMYISGTGSGDKYPAMLENGEYVLNRKAVMAMGGPSELDKLNFSMAPRFASGGSFSNQFEDLTSMEANMTTSGLEESKLYNELRDVKRQEAEQDRQKKRARQQQMAGIIGSLAGAAVSLGLAKGIEKYGQRLNKFGDITKNVTNAELAANMNLAQKGGHIGTRLSDTIPAYATGGLFESPLVKRYAIGGSSSAIGIGGSIAGNSSTVNNNTNATNSFNFNTTVQRDGKIEVGANTTSYAQQDVQLSQSLNSRVYEVVLDTIRKEKRFGGSLAGVRNT